MALRTRADAVKGFTDFILHRDSVREPDTTFDHREMLLDNEKEYMDAAKRNDVKTLRALGKVVKINATNQDGRTALHYAVAGKNMRAVHELLQRRPRLDLQDKHGVSAVHLSAWFGSLDIMQLLVQGGAEQKIENEEGLNILHCAAMNNHTDIVEYIINDLQMKELDKKDLTGHRPFARAAEHGSNDMLQMLMSEDYNMATMRANKMGEGPLHLAAKNGHLGTVQLLLQSFAIRDQVNKAGETALYMAADRGHENCVLALLDAGCDPNILTTAQRSALHPVSERGNVPLVSLLIEKSTHIDTQDLNLQTPLHLAVKNSQASVLYTLVKAGANVNLADQRSQTALHHAAELARVDIVEMLLKAGMDLSLRDRQGKTALGVAARADEIIIVDMIIKAERYFAWRIAMCIVIDLPFQTNAELSNENLHSQSPLTFKLDHRSETKQIRGSVWHLAYRLFKAGDWRKLAFYWGFSKQQVDAIAEQWTGQQSYREHGNRMLLIWLHGVEMSVKNPAKELYQSLIAIGNKKTADKIRMDTEKNHLKTCFLS